MAKRFLAIWFRHLKTDWVIRRQEGLKEEPFVLASPERGRMMIRAANKVAEAGGVRSGMVVADCRAMIPTLQVLDDDEKLANRLLGALAEWCLRYTPIASVDMPDGLFLDISGCAHLWGGERAYLKDILTKLKLIGYDVRAAIADTAGTAWAISRYGQVTAIIDPGQQLDALLQLPPAALRLETATAARLHKLGMHHIYQFIRMPRSALRRRFGQHILKRIDQALGQGIEALQPIQPIQPYSERLPCLDPIRTASGIEIGLKKLLELLCLRLSKDGKGIRTATLKCYRLDGNVQQIAIGTNKVSRNEAHLLRLFELKIGHLEPELGFELFLLEATIVEDLTTEQEMLWSMKAGHDDMELAELLDRLGGKLGANNIHRYLPQEHYWPERSIRQTSNIKEMPGTYWRPDVLRPVHLLPKPEVIEVSVAIPDYPPFLFVYKEKVHRIARADGPERIEREWWIETGRQRDYYCVEDEDGARYWLFRSGHYYNGEKPIWYIHGFFA